MGPQLPQMTLSPIGGEFAQRQGVRWSTPTSANMGHYPNEGDSCFDKRFTQHHSYGNYERFGERGYEFSDRGAYDGAQSRGGQQWPGDEPYHGPSKVSYRDEDLVKDYGEQKKQRHKGTSRTRSKMDAKEKSQSVLFSSSSDSDEEEEQERGRKAGAHAFPRCRLLMGEPMIGRALFSTSGKLRGK